MDQQKLLFDYSLKLLSRRRYTVKELTAKLTKKLGKMSRGKSGQSADTSATPGAADSSEDIEQVIDRLKKLKYLNDEEFAALYIRDQISRKPQGIRLLKNSLAKKGLASEIISDALRAAAPDEMDLARIAILKKSKSLGAYPEKKRDEKLMRFLASRGFSISTIIKLFQSPTAS